jgi:hypothetical protein
MTVQRLKITCKGHEKHMKKENVLSRFRLFSNRMPNHSSGSIDEKIWNYEQWY